MTKFGHLRAAAFGCFAGARSGPCAKGSRAIDRHPALRSRSWCARAWLGLALTWVHGAAPAVTGGFSIDTQDRFLARAFFNSVYLSSEGLDPGWTGDLSSCTPGTTTAAFRDAVVTRINYFRAMAGVPATISLRADYDAKAQAAALMMSRNRALSHFPPSNWACWSQAGSEAAGSSNLSLGSLGADAVANQVRDNGDNNAAAGHRRWLLFPQTLEMGTGDVPATGLGDEANAVWVFDNHYHDARPTTRDAFVAWPPPGYVPYQAVYPRWSFSYPGADFSLATVTMSRNGTAIGVTTESPVIGVGENSLVWIPQGRDPTGTTDDWSKPTDDISFDVTVSGVVSGGQPGSFSYRVVVMDPARAGAGEVVANIAGPAQVSVGQAAFYSFPAIPHAIGYELSGVALAAYARLEGAEPGTLTAIIDGTDPDYPLAATGVSASGTASFHLAHPHGGLQFFALAERFLVGPAGSLGLKTRLGWASSDQVAKAQVSLDDGATWQDLWTQAGTGGPGEAAFTVRTLSLAHLAGRVVNLRFVYDFAQGTYYYGVDDGVGFYLDDIEVSGVERIAAETLSPLGTNGFTATATDQGRIGYRVRAGLWAGLPALEWGPLAAVQVVAAPATQTLAITKAGFGAGRVSSSPTGIDCGGTCSADYLTGTPVTLIAVAESGSLFAGWSGACSGIGTCEVTLDAARVVTATFNLAGDDDGDRMPNEWELAHGLDPTTPDANRDPDQDGINNVTEYLSGTNPQDPKDFPRSLLIPSRGGWRAVPH